MSCGFMTLKFKVMTIVILGGRGRKLVQPENTIPTVKYGRCMDAYLQEELMYFTK